MAATVMRRVTLRVPGDKSITHRALLFASLASGESRIRDALDAADTRSTACVLRALGVAIPDTSHHDIVIRGAGLHAWRSSTAPLDCGNSGTTARLLMGALAGQAFDAVLTGDESLQSRPMRRVTTPLGHMGAVFTEMGGPDHLPIAVRGGALSALEYHSPQSSAQVKSALLLAALVGDAPVSVTEPRLSRDHSERMLAAMGAVLQQSIAGDGAHTVRISGSAQLEPLDMRVPADFSSAAFFVACGLMTPGVTIVLPSVGLNPGRTGMIDVVRRMNGTVVIANERLEANEPVGDLEVSAAALRAVTITATEVPSLIDEIPVIAALAARADGETRITGANELRVKETDRIRALVENLRAIGVEADELEDGLVVQGTTSPLKGRIRCHGDHRIAMAFGVLGAIPGNDITVDDPGAVSVSFPDFWRQLASVVDANGDA